MSDQRRSPSLQSVNSTDSFGSLGSIDSVASPVRKTRPFNHDSNSMLASAEISAHGIGSKAHDMPSPTDTSHNHDVLCEYSSGCFSPSPAPTRKHPRFYLDSRTFEIKLDDGSLYRVFRQTFETHSTAFAAQYLGSSVEDEPTALSGVSAEDLDRFLSLIYPSELATCELSTADEWLSVLRLAHKWSFSALRTRAIREILLAGSAVDKIAVAREFADIEELQGWLLPAFKEACSAPGWLRLASLQDAERLGAGTILAIARIREEARDAEEGMYDVERAIVVAGLAPGPAAEKICTTSQADVLRSLFSGRPAGLTGATIDDSCPSATAREPPTLVSTAPAYFPRMPHHEDVSWPLPKAPWGAQSARQGVLGLVAESISSTPATISHLNMANEHEEEPAPPSAAETPPIAMPEVAPSLPGFEAQLRPAPQAESWSTSALASAPASCSATAMSTDKVASSPIVTNQVPCATSLPGSAPSPSEATANDSDALSRNALSAVATTAPSVPIDVQPAAPMSLNAASSSTDGYASCPTMPTISRPKLGKHAKKKLMRREQEMRKQEEERRAEAARTNSATLVPESADGARKEEQAGYPALACNTAGAKGQVEEPHAAVAVP